MTPNKLFRNELVVCSRPALAGKVLTLDCEIQVGKHAWSWRVGWYQTWVDINGVKHVTRMFEVVPERELEPVEGVA